MNRDIKKARKHFKKSFKRNNKSSENKEECQLFIDVLGPQEYIKWCSREARNGTEIPIINAKEMVIVVIGYTTKIKSPSIFSKKGRIGAPIICAIGSADRMSIQDAATIGMASWLDVANQRNKYVKLLDPYVRIKNSLEYGAFEKRDLINE